MSMQFQIKPGYFGQCPQHFDREAKHEIYVPFDYPVGGGEKIWTEDNGWITLPAITGIREYVCDECFANHKADEVLDEMFSTPSEVTTSFDLPYDKNKGE